MTKKEIQLIVGLDWDARRVEAKEKAARRSSATKAWKDKEKRIEAGVEPPPLRRRKNYISIKK